MGMQTAYMRFGWNFRTMVGVQSELSFSRIICLAKVNNKLPETQELYGVVRRLVDMDRGDYVASVEMKCPILDILGEGLGLFGNHPSSPVIEIEIEYSFIEEEEIKRLRSILDPLDVDSADRLPLWLREWHVEVSLTTPHPKPNMLPTNYTIVFDPEGRFAWSGLCFDDDDSRSTPIVDRQAIPERVAMATLAAVLKQHDPVLFKSGPQLDPPPLP